MSPRRTLDRLSVAAAVLTLAVTLAAGQGPLEKVTQDEAAKKIEPVVVRMYNIQDLLLGRDRPYAAGVLPVTMLGWRDGGTYSQAAAGGGSLFGNQAAVAADEASLTSALSPQVVDEILRRTVDPESWDDCGGSGRIERVGALLVITQTEANHKQIAALLDQFRSARPMVSIEARWVLLDDAQAAKLLPPAGGRRPVPFVLAPEALAQPEARVIYRGQITCFDRQTVHLASGRAKTIVSGAEPVVSENTAAMDPHVDTFLLGAMLEITPSIAPNGESATVDLKSVVSEGGDVRKRPVPAADKQAPTVELDLPEFLVHTFQTTLRVPIDKAVLIGGITSPTTTDGKVLYLVLEVSSSKEEPKKGK